MNANIIYTIFFFILPIRKSALLPLKIKMKEKIIAILSDLRPEFDFTDESLNFIEEGMLDSFDVVCSC